MKQIDEKVPLDQRDDLVIANVSSETAEIRKERRSATGVLAARYTPRDAHADQFNGKRHWANLTKRLRNVEREGRRLTYALLVVLPLLLYVFVDQFFTEQLATKESLVATDRMQLFDEEGNVRMYMRVYSGVPIVQLIDESGTPRLSLGLRYDDSPFISLSDISGKTRASLQMGADDQPELKLFDENGNASFSAH